MVAHDTSVAASFVFRTVGMLRRVDVLSFWAFSDIFEEVGLPTREFDGFYGLETIHGIAKPARRAFELLHRHAGDQRVETQVTHVGARQRRGEEGGGAPCSISESLGCYD